MKSSDYFPSKYLKADDLKGRTVTLTISHLMAEDVGNPPEQKPVLYFKETEKGLVLNKTNYGVVTYINNGDDESDNWAGIKVSLVAEMKTFQGKPIMGLSVKPPEKPATPTTTRGATKIEPLDPDDIIPF